MLKHSVDSYYFLNRNICYLSSQQCVVLQRHVVYKDLGFTFIYLNEEIILLTAFYSINFVKLSGQLLWGEGLFAVVTFNIIQ